jgi:23S rRNA G2069 N7-methylase RlmK/C1962 C5-methylase RlmI
MSNTYLDWAKVNFTLNGLQSEVLPQEAFFTSLHTLPPFRLIRADVLRFLDDAVKKKYTWDIILLDPPTFSNSRKMFSSFDVNRDYQNLIMKCLKLLKKDGKLYFSTNARHFNGEWENGAVPKNITGQLQDEDFCGKKIPGCWVFGES